MEEASLTRLAWLKHAQEEALDLAVYLQKLIEMETHNPSASEPKEEYECDECGIDMGAHPTITDDEYADFQNTWHTLGVKSLLELYEVYKYINKSM